MGQRSMPRDQRVDNCAHTPYMVHSPLGAQVPRGGDDGHHRTRAYLCWRLITPSAAAAASPSGDGVVEQEERARVVAYHAQFLDQLTSGLLFLHLLSNEPLQEHLRGVVLLAHGERVEVVDSRRDRALVLKRLAEDIERRGELVWRLRNRLEEATAATIKQEIEKFERVGDLLATLLPHSVRETSQTDGLEIAGGGEVEVGRVELFADLVANRLLDRFFHH